ncbi:MAG: polyisoprenyl-phosphate glycosyltransferase [Acidobacteriaceae bacterium]|jgi:glycosyltransferase involved in cell wall biosynthesis|nr:polyisoprenyl-phosphate glycosyltransferase [Acidobacteriaceae bacterium]MDX6463266.1 polyisoprenyl-phosphate glycosyltransferase [Acidobacteriaceae bacterium]MEA2262783.1 polyisoprenyl-phosphate glycosyltransferase [Acidobacteriaceae bacterium]MEA2542761.1 polyisoprenyl-phosphate glycosyltransferase [Acidobacteriaceae bacterium]MEA3005319.1 polyisoprenyl-phosphate glycosyltransferase [Acidobacteriaceae bacterium]
MPSHSPTISVIVPCYNEEEVLLHCHTRLMRVFESTPEDEFELVYVNDGSTDRTDEVLRYLNISYPQTRVVMLSRNFGHQAAVSAGLTAATGRCVVILDADLQDPPELIWKMVDLWRKGYEVVYGVRESRAGESSFKLWTAQIFYRLINKLSDVEIPLDTGDFRLLDRRAVEAILAMPERHRLLRGMASWIGFRQFGLKYARDARFAGTTKYPFRKMINLALDGIFSFSTVPLRFVTTLGLVTSAMALAGIFYSLVVRIFTPHWVPGWATLILAVLLTGGIEMFCFGILGEYIGRIYTEIKQRPLFVVREMLEPGVRAAELKLRPQATLTMEIISDGLPRTG